MESYDSGPDIRLHIERVREWLARFYRQLEHRANLHDASKLAEPEKSMFDRYTWRLKQTEFGSAEYQAQLAEMNQSALPAHYAANRHHPEHFPNGINDMTLVDLVEMVCDWLAACEAKQVPVNLDLLAERFGIGPQLATIIHNQLTATQGNYAPANPACVLLWGEVTKARTVRTSLAPDDTPL